MVPRACLKLVDAEPSKHSCELEEGGGEIEPVEGTKELGGEGRERGGGPGAVDEVQGQEPGEGEGCGDEVEDAEREDDSVCC